MSVDLQFAKSEHIYVESGSYRKDAAMRGLNEYDFKMGREFNTKTSQYQNIKSGTLNKLEKNCSNFEININTTDVINTVKSGVNPQLENIRDYVNKIPPIIDMLPMACSCAATASAVDGMMHFHSKVAQHVDKLAKTGDVMTEIAQMHEDLDKKLAQMSYH